MICLGEYKVYLDFMIERGGKIGVVSVFERSQQLLKAFCATMNIKTSKDMIEVKIGGKIKKIPAEGTFRNYIVPIVVGKERYYHAILVNEEFGNKLMLSTVDRSSEDFYNLLMEKFDLPLLEWWGDHLFAEALRTGYVNHENGRTEHYFGEYSINQDLRIKGIKLADMELYDVSLYTSDVLKTHISQLFKDGTIWISRNEQRPFVVESMDDYFSAYGHTLVKNLEKMINPLSPLNGDVNSLALRNMRLYPQQGAMVNGVLQLLKVSNYAILNEGMGVGKTIQAASICEGYFVEKYLRMHRGLNLKDVYSAVDIIKYRNIVMCPGHMVEKWAHEIAKEIPFSKVHILQDFSQLIRLRKEGPKRTCREFWVTSKDFAKLSYMSKPVPVKIGWNRTIKEKVCDSCGEIFVTPGKKCPKCGNIGYHGGNVIGRVSGLICPECGEVLMANKTMQIESAEESYTTLPALMPSDYAVQTIQNQRCYHCGQLMWQPFVANIDQVNLFSSNKKKPVWYRATHYANKTHKAVKSVWVHRRYARDYFLTVGENPISQKEDMNGFRKYSPALFIKRYMKDFFDIAVFDEAHLYKGGATGQGNAMDALIKSSKKQLALTGTIAGGMAEHLFYLLYRLDPRRMKSHGYEWSDVMKFTEKYGALERSYEVYEAEKNDEINAMTRGKQIGSVRSKPGISPLIFTDFLLDRAVFLDLSDMSKYLPPLKEYVITVPFSNREKEMYASYKRVIETLLKASKTKGGKGLLGRMLQFSLSYLDKPYGEEEILNPKDGSLVCRIPQYTHLWNDGMLPKEKKLIELVRNELNEGRNCFIFAEYTASPQTCITNRLKDLIERDLKVKVAVLESSSPEPLKREAWIHEQAEREGVQVIISNPKCVETGLDFCWDTNGVRYNFPTLIFYQMGYSLFTIWQAAMRHYRLIQREECRTYYIGYSDTVQTAIIQLIAEKQVATSAIQGKFSTEGLAAMAQGVDTKTRLAQALSEKDFSSGEGLQNMFDVLEVSKSEDEYSEFIPMKILSEIIGKDMLESLDAYDKDIFDIEDLMNELWGDDYEKSDKTESQSSNTLVLSRGKEIDVMSLFGF